MSKNGYISVSGVEYNKAETSTIDSTQEVGTKVPITFSFLYSPSTTTFSNTALTPPTLFTFDEGDYHIMEFTISVWNPNSTPGSNIGNAILTNGFIFIDSEGATNSVFTGDSNNMGLYYFFLNNSDIGDDVSLTTSLGGISGTPYSILSSGTSFAALRPFFNVSASGIVSVKIHNLKSGYRIKGLVTLS
jgi:hypothetical protein